MVQMHLVWKTFPFLCHQRRPDFISDLATVSHFVSAALDFVLSFQVHHIASVFPIDGCDYTSCIHKLAIAALLSGATGER